MISRWISLHNASQLYKIPEKVFYNIIEEGDLTCSIIGTRILMKKSELENYLQTHPDLIMKESDHTHKTLLIEEVEQAIHEAHGYDSSIFQLFMEEISLLITDTRKRALFLDASIDGDLRKIASKYKLDQKAAWYQYKSAKRMIAERIGIIKTFRSEKAAWLLLNRKLQIEINNIKNENESLKQIIREQRLISENQLDGGNSEKDLNNKIVRLLSTSLETNFQMSRRLLNCLLSQRMKTVEDLLRFIKKNGFEGFHSISLYGKKCEEELKECLQKANLVDKDGHSELFDYLK